jgi:hypothetical protein
MNEHLKAAIVKANKSIWDGGKTAKITKNGLYEVWYLIIDDIPREQAYWIRYTLMCPQIPKISRSKENILRIIEDAGGGAMLWFGFFDAKNPGQNYMVKKSFPLTQLKGTSGDLVVGIGGAELTFTGAKGNFTTKKGRSIAWDVNFDHFQESYISVPEIANKLKLTNTLLLGTHPNLRINGQITVDGITKKFKHVPGIQYHTFGDGYKIPWEWLSIHTFKENPDAYLDFGYKISKGTIGFFDGQENHFIWNANPLKKLLMMKKIQRKKSLTDLEFSTDFKGITLKGSIHIPQNALLGVEYKGPQGNSYYCYNSEIASASVSLQIRNKIGEIIKSGEFHAEKSVAFETVYESPQAGVPYLPWDAEEL